MKIVIGGDHAGWELKQALSDKLRSEGHEIVDIGAHAYDADDDYPDFALAVGRAVAAGEGERGVVVCGSGVGASVAANKVRGVRASLCHDTYSARQGVEHDDLNVLCLGGRVIGWAVAEVIVDEFIRAKFHGTGRYQRRLQKILDAEEAL